MLFNHSTHTIGTLKPARPLAQLLRPGRPGAGEGAGRDVPLLRRGLGLDPQPRPAAPRRSLRIKAAVADALDRAQPRPVGARRGACAGRSPSGSATSTRPADDAAVVAYATQAVSTRSAATDRSRIFRDMRKELAPRQGRGAEDLGPGDRRSATSPWSGVPGEFFTVLGPGDQAPFAVPLHLRLRAGQRLHRLPPRRPRPTSWAATRPGPACTATWRKARARRSSIRRWICSGSSTRASRADANLGLGPRSGHEPDHAPPSHGAEIPP